MLGFKKMSMFLCRKDSNNKNKTKNLEKRIGLFVQNDFLNMKEKFLNWKKKSQILFFPI